MKQIKLIINIFIFVFLTTASVFAMPPQLKVVGNQIVTASGGCTVRLTGVNLDSLEWDVPPGDSPAGGNGVMTMLQEAVQYWNVNCVRVPLDQDWWDGNAQSSRGSTSQSGYQSFVDSLVTYCNTNNIYIDIDLQWSGDGATGSATQQDPMPDENSLVFWASMAARYANNPSVLFDRFNEPFTGSAGPNSWAIWLNGGSVPAGNNGGGQTWNTYTTPGLQGILNTIRGTTASGTSTLASSTYANNVCIAGGWGYSYDYGTDGTGAAFTPITDPGISGGITGNGVSYSAHIYNNKGTNTPAGWESNIDPALTYGPVFIEEFGNSQNVTDNGTFVSSVITWMNGTNDKNYVYGGMAWDMDLSAGPTLMTNWSSTLSAPVSTGTTGWVLTSFEGQQVYGWLKGLTYPTCSSSGATATSTNTATQTATNTATRTVTNTATHTATQTATNTATHTFTNTATNTATVTSTNTATRTSTSTATQTATNTATLTPAITSTFTNTATNTASSTATNSRTSTATNSPTHTTTNTATQTVTNTATLTPIITSTFTNTMTNTSTQTPTNTATNTASSTATNSVTSTETHTSTNTATTTSTNTPTQTATNTATLTPAISSPFTNTATNSSTNTASSTATHTPTPTQTATNTATLTPANTGTFTNTPTHTSTSTASSTVTNTPTPTATNTPTHTATTTPTVTSTYSKTNTPTATLTSSPTNTFTPTGTPTITPTYTPTITSEIIISAPFPNPSNGTPITFNIQVPGESTVTLDVFTLAFRKIYSETAQADGPLTLQWDLK